VVASQCWTNGRYRELFGRKRLPLGSGQLWSLHSVMSGCPFQHPLTAVAAPWQWREPVTARICGFEPVIIIALDVAAVDTACRDQFTGTEMLPCLLNERVVPGRITNESAAFPSTARAVTNPATC
jgi:hypothetical protein